MKKIGLIGAGSMGGAIARGLLESGYVRAAELAVCDPKVEALEAVTRDWPQVTALTSADDLAGISEMIILAVKPYLLEQVVNACADNLQGKAVVSIAAGWTASRLAALLEPLGARWLRVMPNTPALVGEGMTALCQENTLTKAELDFARGVFDALGKTVVLPIVKVVSVAAVTAMAAAAGANFI